MTAPSSSASSPVEHERRGPDRGDQRARLRGAVRRRAGVAAPGPEARPIPDPAYAAFYADGGDQLFVAIGLYLVPFAGIAFLWHMTAIRNVLDTLTPAPSTMAHGLNLLAGVIFVTLLFAGTAAVGAVAFGVYFGHTPAEDPAVARALTGVGYGLVFIFAVRGAGMFALTTTTLLRTARVLPRDPGRRRLPARRVPAARRDQQPRRRPRLPGVGRADLGLPAAPRRRLPIAPPDRTPDTTRPTVGATPS